jgi:hypothetical protein
VAHRLSRQMNRNTLLALARVCHRLEAAPGGGCPARPRVVHRRGATPSSSPSSGPSSSPKRLPSSSPSAGPSASPSVTPECQTSSGPAHRLAALPPLNAQRAPSSSPGCCSVRSKCGPVGPGCYSPQLWPVRLLAAEPSARPVKPPSAAPCIWCGSECGSVRLRCGAGPVRLGAGLALLSAGPSSAQCRTQCWPGVRSLECWQARDSASPAPVPVLPQCDASAIPEPSPGATPSALRLLAVIALASLFPAARTYRSRGGVKSQRYSLVLGWRAFKCWPGASPIRLQCFAGAGPSSAPSSFSSALPSSGPWLYAVANLARYGGYPRRFS